MFQPLTIVAENFNEVLAAAVTGLALANAAQWRRNNKLEDKLEIGHSQHMADVKSFHETTMKMVEAMESLSEGIDELLNSA